MQLNDELKDAFQKELVSERCASRLTNSSSLTHVGNTSSTLVTRTEQHAAETKRVTVSLFSCERYNNVFCRPNYAEVYDEFQ